MSENPLAILADIELDPQQGGLTEQLQLALGAHASKISKIFSLMDKGSLTVSKEEFSSVLLEHMHLRCDKQTIDVLFDAWDGGRKGELTLEALEDALHGSAAKNALFQHNLTKYDEGAGQGGKPVAAALYWSGTVVFAVASSPSHRSSRPLRGTIRTRQASRPRCLPFRDTLCTRKAMTTSQAPRSRRRAGSPIWDSCGTRRWCCG